MAKPGESLRGRLVLVSYDIADARRLRRVARICGGFGMRVQRSVFECFLNDGQLRDLRAQIARVVDPVEDKFACVRLCGKCRRAIVIDGQGERPVDWDYYLA